MQYNSVCDAGDEARDMLLAHAFVGSASVCLEEQIAGQRYLMAYVVPSDLWTTTMKSQTHQVHQEKRVSQWKRVFDRTYGGSGGCKPDFTGWTDSFTNSAIPESEMREWLDATIQRIAALKPTHLLEIGCGIGLLTQTLAPMCESYYGSDLSSTAVSRLQEFTETQPQLSHIELTQREATDFRDVRPRSLDTIVLNSVIQYFPNLTYLLNVLEGAARSVAPGGHIFVGDVRHFGLLRILQSSVQFAKASPDASVRWLKQKIALSVEQEAELVVDPQFFLALPQSDLPIVGAEILIKRGHARNELTRYRYDVLLHVGETKRISSRQEIEWPAGGTSIDDLVSRLKGRKFPSVRITGVPNRRIARDLAVTRALSLAGDMQSVKEIMVHVDASEDVGVDPETIWESRDVTGYDVSVGWSPGSLNGSFDITLTDRDQCAEPPSVAPLAVNPPDLASMTFATDPLTVAQMNKLSLDLGEMLRTRLPEALLPAAVIVTNKLPANASNGVIAP